MNLVLLLQSGDSGPVKVISATDRGMRRSVESLQRGNPQILHIRAVLDGDERLERRLHVAWEAHYRGRDWYEPVVLGLVPLDAPRYGDHDEYEEQRRIAALGLDDLVRKT